MSILRYLDFFLKIQIYSTGCPRKWCQFMCGEPFSPMAMFSGTPGVSVLDWGLSQSQGLLGYCNKANLSNVLELNVSYSLKDCHVYGCLKVKKNVHRWFYHTRQIFNLMAFYILNWLILKGLPLTSLFLELIHYTDL